MTVSPASSASTGPGTISLRSGILIHLRPKERLILSYDIKTESLVIPSASNNNQTSNESEVVSLISDDHLRALDPGLASYPFEGLERWKDLTRDITDSVLKDVLGKNGAGVDGMRGVEGDDDDLAATGGDGVEGVGGPGYKMRFAPFDLRRSWGEGVVGEDLTRQARDKSWLLGRVIDGLGGGMSNSVPILIIRFHIMLFPIADISDPMILLAHLQLAFILVLHLSSPASLTVYKRIFSLLARSADIHLHPSAHLPVTRHRQLRTLYIQLVTTLSAQISALPDGAFDTELPELDIWFAEEIDSLRVNLGSGLGIAGGMWEEEQGNEELRTQWEMLRGAARRKFAWQIGELGASEGQAGLDDDEAEEEEGEYAPVIVEM